MGYGNVAPAAFSNSGFDCAPAVAVKAKRRNIRTSVFLMVFGVLLCRESLSFPDCYARVTSARIRHERPACLPGRVERRSLGGRNCASMAGDTRVLLPAQTTGRQNSEYLSPDRTPIPRSTVQRADLAR